ncbi:MAG: Gfo/Idh/MocA family oxidoreductase [Telmatospirillum sp.]|nr:Gfo/Idh/MocA family oxidoreductase [Telmatospirillum sp.]
MTPARSSHLSDPPAPLPAHQVLLVGCGASGKRFLRVFDHLERATGGRIALAGTVDRARPILPGRPDPYRDLTTALSDLKPDSVIVSVNEKDHFEVLETLAAHPVRHILCEKPLTRTLAEARSLMPALADRWLALNMVERYSPVVEDFRTWLRANPGVRPTRIQFFWGKHRVRDPRPTMGVMSELIHPLDLAAYLFDLGSWTVVDGFTHHSDFAHDTDSLDDSIHCILSADGVVVSAHASFAWHDRRRELAAFLTDDAGNHYHAVLSFDVPLWDCDSLVVQSLCPSAGTRALVLERRYANGDFLPELHQVHKLMRFAVDGLGEPVGESRRVDLSQAVGLQALLEKITRSFAAAGRRAARPLFHAGPGPPANG